MAPVVLGTVVVMAAISAGWLAVEYLFPCGQKRHFMFRRGFKVLRRRL